MELASATIRSREGKPRRVIEVELWELSVEPDEELDFAHFLVPGTEFVSHPQIKLIKTRLGVGTPIAKGIDLGEIAGI